jgi:hypothetical protein
MDLPSFLCNLYPEESAVFDEKKMALGGKESRGGFMGLYARVVRGLGQISGQLAKEASEEFLKESTQAWPSHDSERLSVNDPMTVTQD